MSQSLSSWENTLWCPLNRKLDEPNSWTGYFLGREKAHTPFRFKPSPKSTSP